MTLLVHQQEIAEINNRKIQNCYLKLSLTYIKIRCQCKQYMNQTLLYKIEFCNSTDMSKTISKSVEP